MACMNRIMSLWSNRKTVKRSKHTDDEDDDDVQDKQPSSGLPSTNMNVTNNNNTTTNNNSTTSTTSSNNASEEMKLILLGKDQLVHDMVRATMDVCTQKNVASSFWSGLLLYIIPCML